MAFLFVSFQNGIVLFTCGKIMRFGTSHERGFFGIWCIKYLAFGTSAVDALRSKKFVSLILL